MYAIRSYYVRAPLAQRVDQQHAAARRVDLLRPGLLKVKIDIHVGMNGDDALLQHLAVAPHGHLRCADLGALILDAETDDLRLADDAETRVV